MSRDRVMTGAPASVHQSARRRAALIVEREYRPDPARCIAAIVRLLTYRADPSDTPSADDGGAPGAGDQPMHNNDRVSPPRDNPAVAEDDRHVATPTDD